MQILEISRFIWVFLILDSINWHDAASGNIPVCQSSNKRKFFVICLTFICICCKNGKGNFSSMILLNIVYTSWSQNYTPTRGDIQVSILKYLWVGRASAVIRYFIPHYLGYKIPRAAH